MAETKTATYKRYNGKDWDTIYFATSASQVGESSSRFFIKPGSNTVNGKQFTENGGITLYSTDIKLSNSDTTTVKDAIAQAMGAIPTGVLTTTNYATTLDSVYEKKSDATSAHNTLTNKIDNLTTAVNNRYTKTESDNKYQPKGTYATLGTDGKVPSSQLPSYVDDVIEGYYSNGKFYSDSAKTKEITGEGGKIYTDLASNKTYRWGGTEWVEISASLALGETEGTAYDGAKGAQVWVTALGNSSDIEDLKSGKADKATTLAGYGITDAYTKTESNSNFASKSVATISEKGLMSSSDKTKLDGIATGATKNNPRLEANKSGFVIIDNGLVTGPAIILKSSGSTTISYDNGTYTFSTPSIDSALSSTSTNAVENKVVNTAIESINNNISTIEGNYVTTDTDQSITGSKILTNSVVFKSMPSFQSGDIKFGTGVPSAPFTVFNSYDDGESYFQWYNSSGDDFYRLFMPGIIYGNSDRIATEAVVDTKISHRATKIYFEDTVPTSGMVAGDICIEY